MTAQEKYTPRFEERYKKVLVPALKAKQGYKNIHEVMKAQTDLVDVLATFYPRMVRMADDGSRED